jgi:hypothetical protein
MLMQVAFYVVACLMAIAATVIAMQPNTPTYKGLRWWSTFVFAIFAGLHLWLAIVWSAARARYVPWLLGADATFAILIFLSFSLEDGQEATRMPELGAYKIVCLGLSGEFVHVIALIPDSNGGMFSNPTYFKVPYSEVKESEGERALIVREGTLQVRPLHPDERIRYR